MPRDKRDKYQKPGRPMKELLRRHGVELEPEEGELLPTSGEEPENLPSAPVLETADDDRPLEEHVLVPARNADRRIDVYLADRFPRFSRSAIQHLIEANLITVNGLACKSSYRLKAGDKVDLSLPPPELTPLKPEPIPLDILYEDEYFIVVNKQPGLIVHPARGHMSGTLLNALVYHFGRENLSDFHEDPTRPGVVHRLDRDTTGVIVVAKTEEAHWKLAVSFERREVEKEYVAVCEGLVELDGDVIDLPIGKHPKVREKMAIRHDGKPAQTKYEVQARYPVPKGRRQANSSLPAGYTLVRLLPHTGRTHQLRVHLAYLGYPLVGDVAYGGGAVTAKDLLGEGADLPTITRQALHARRLALAHPITGVPMSFEAPLPQDLRDTIGLLERMGGGAVKA